MLSVHSYHKFPKKKYNNNNIYIYVCINWLLVEVAIFDGILSPAYHSLETEDHSYYDEHYDSHYDDHIGGHYE